MLVNVRSSQNKNAANLTIFSCSLALNYPKLLCFFFLKSLKKKTEKLRLNNDDLTFRSIKWTRSASLDHASSMRQSYWAPLCWTLNINITKISVATPWVKTPTEQNVSSFGGVNYQNCRHFVQWASSLETSFILLSAFRMAEIVYIKRTNVMKINAPDNEHPRVHTSHIHFMSLAIRSLLPSELLSWPFHAGDDKWVLFRE